MGKCFSIKHAESFKARNFKENTAFSHGVDTLPREGYILLISSIPGKLP
ncbi:MAG: hypothetical protein JWM59_1250 [Verrucomicrobiales bacterium]|nr:hypothetical protein [Verrucomicrobiales bacterium]